MKAADKPTPNLILGRRVGETIVINKEIVITLIDSAKGRARLSIKAPESVDIRRGEVEPQIVTTKKPEKELKKESKEHGEKNSKKQSPKQIGNERKKSI